MKAISLLEPWASLVAVEAKKNETRSWSPNHRGLIAIHASMSFPKAAKELCQRPPFSKYVTTTGTREHRGYPYTPFAFGHIIAVCRIIDVAPTLAEYPAAFALSEEYEFGNYHLGRYIWRVKDVRRLENPVRCKGALSLWEVPQDVREEIEAQLGRRGFPCDYKTQRPGGPPSR
jgi:activating signal cointegrator 1